MAQLPASSFQRLIERSRAWSWQLAAGGSAALAAALILWSSGTSDPIRSPWSVVPTPFFLLYAVVAAMSITGMLAPRAAGSGDLPARREAREAGTVSAEGGRATERFEPEPTRWGGEGARAREATRPQQRAGLLSIGAALALASLVAILVYPLGFGFDHFIHAAAERIIAATGSLSPPPLFYSGHYGLTILLADLLPGVGVDLADRLLSPVLVIILLVPLAYRSLAEILPTRAARLGVSSLLIVPFLPLTVSTPQATANVFALATLFLLFFPGSMHEKCQQLGAGRRSPDHEATGAGMEPEPSGEGERPSDLSERGTPGRASVSGERHPRPQLLVPPLTALAALLSQPMTGIIAIAVVAMAFAWRRRWRAIGIIAAALGATGIPLAFAITGRVVPNLDPRVAFDPLPALQRLGSALRDALAITATDFSTADAIEFVRLLLPLLWVGIAVAGSIRLITQKSEKDYSLIRANRRMVRLAFLFAPIIALLAAALVAATVTVPTQLGEEQSQFPLRLVQLAALLATPLAAIGLGTILSKFFSPSLRRGSEWWRGTPWHQSLAMALIFGALATFNVLLAYPRDDAQARSGLWSVSADDVAAVHAIANDASDASAGASGDASYVVLANQMLGAAAIREFGFRPAHTVCRMTTEYTNGPESTNTCLEILAFPLPAGGPMARKYWEFVSQDLSQCFSPSRGEGEREGEGDGCLSRDPIDAAMDLVGAQRAYVVIHDYWRNSERLAAATASIANAEVGQFSHLRIFRFIRVHPEEPKG